MKQFLVEVFASRASARELSATEKRARAATAALSASAAIRYVGATYIPEDETCFYVFEASSRDLVARAAGLAGLDQGRIVEARTTESSPTS